MKKKLFIIFIFVILFFIRGNGQEKNRGIESLVPAEAALFAKTSKISDIVKALNYMIDSFMDVSERQDIMKSRSEIMDTAGIDILDPSSLEKSGIDTKRPAGFAYFSRKKDGEEMLVMIPVLNMDKFPLKFVEFLKNMNKDNPGFDLNPVVTAYRDYKIQQIQKDIFTTAIGGYFLIAPTGDVIKKTIDLAYGDTGALMNDPKYMEYDKRKKETYDLDFFARKEFLMETLDSPMEKKEADPGGKNMRDNGQGGSGKDSMKNEPSFAGSVDYAGAGLSIGKGRIKIKAASNFNANHPMTGILMGILKTGIGKRALSCKKPLFYMFFSYNHEYMNNVCETPSSVCSMYKSSVKKFEADMGIDLMKDFVPGFSGGVNIVVSKLNPATGKGEYAVYLPMDNEAKTIAAWNKMKDSVKKRSSKTGGFGEGKILNARAFWYNENMEKIFILADKRGLYTGNSQELLKTSLTGGDMAMAAPGDHIKQKMTADTFFVIYINNDKSLTGMLKSMAGKAPGVNRAADTISDIYIRGIKESNYLSIDVEINFIELKKNK